MQPCIGQKTSSLSLHRADGEPLQTTLEREKTLFLEYSGADYLHLKSDLLTSADQIKTLQTLTLPTHCYAVEFNDQSVTIFPLK